MNKALIFVASFFIAYASHAQKNTPVVLMINGNLMWAMIPPGRGPVIMTVPGKQ